MKYLSLILSFMSFVCSAQDKYYGAKSTEAMLSFEGKILLNSPMSAAKKKEAIQEQINYLIGHLQAPTHLAKFRYPGVMGENNRIVLKNENTIASGLLVSYQFVGRVNFHRNVFGRDGKAIVPLNLPLSLDRIYSLGVVNGKNRCTDPTYDSEGDFFYFWDPDKEGCPLKGNTTDVLRLKGKLQQLENTTATYPEYDQLYQKPEIKISVFFGYIDRATNRDFSAYAFREQVQILKDMGLVFAGEERSGINCKARFVGEIKTQLGSKQNLDLTIWLTDTDLGASDKLFHREIVKAFREDDIIAYDGHSGLGGNLDLNLLPQFKFNSNYQIFFFNGCSSYPYFNAKYFAAKPGGKSNLDIITSGLPTLTSTSVTNMTAFLTPFVKGHLPSWQTIMNRIEASNGEEATYLMGVNGDEGNRFRPSR
ncbi:MAG: hypothetical protein LW878_08390 [Proteobacteria bacterium]|nr:hypothetical protein [Pseudomonadota bacterium]